MNGIHDMGGMQDMGPVRIEKDEPVFHEAWEGRVHAINRALGAWNRWNIDAGRFGLEILPPEDYLRMSYYERWLVRNLDLVVKHGLVTQEELHSGKTAPGARKETPPLRASDVPAIAAFRPSYKRDVPGLSPNFVQDQPVRAKTMNPVGHTRLPRYVRGRQGVIAGLHGIFVFPDTNAHFEGEQPQYLYSVRFTARELWGDAASPKDSVWLDLWESYLEHI